MAANNRYRVVLVTGASSGIGRTTATLLARHGYRVFGTSRDGVAPPGAPYEMVKLELSSDESVRQCVREVLSQAGRIDVLFNNAGFGVAGAIEETTVEQAQAQFEVFLFGIHRMLREVLPLMRSQQGGRVINMGSSASIFAVPYGGLYSAGKYAMAGYSEALRRELLPLNIWVTYVEATMISTEAADDIMVAADRIDDYTPLRDDALRLFRKAIKGGKDPEIVARAVHRLVEMQRPPLVYRVDTPARLLPMLKAIAPSGLVDRVLGRRRRH